MNRTDWSRPTTTQEAHRRAGGRRRYNARRKAAASRRRWAVYNDYFVRSRRLTVEEMAERYAVSTRTIRSDLQHLKRLRSLWHRWCG